MHDEIERYWHELVCAMQTMPFDTLVSAVELLLDCYRRGSTIFILGNGGSAATASHFACDLAKDTQVPSIPAFRVVALSDNVPLLTAWANDTNYDRVFAEQLATLVRLADVVVAISASGNSPNVLEAARIAQQSEAIVIALTGQCGGQLYQVADLTISVPAEAIEQVEDTHFAVAHSLCVVIRRRLYVEAALRVEQSVLRHTMADG